MQCSWKLSDTLDISDGYCVIASAGLGPNVRWEISQIWIEYIKPIGQMSDESWKFLGYTDHGCCCLGSLYSQVIGSYDIKCYRHISLLLFRRKNFNCLCLLSFEKWYKMQIYLCVFSGKSVQTSTGCTIKVWEWISNLILSHTWLNWAWDYLSMLGLNLNHVCQRGPCRQSFFHISMANSAKLQ